MKSSRTALPLLLLVSATAWGAGVRNNAPHRKPHPHPAGWLAPAGLAAALHIDPSPSIIAETEPWSSGSRTLAAAIYVTTDESLSLVLFEQKDGRPNPIATLTGITRTGTNASLESLPVQAGPDDWLIGLREKDTATKRETVRLFRIEGKTFREVFDRVVASGPPSNCSAKVTSDGLGPTPFPLKVTESCIRTGRTSAEMWRWNGTRYVLHGPPSDAAVSEDVFKAAPVPPPR